MDRYLQTVLTGINAGTHRHADSIFFNNFIYFYFWLSWVLLLHGLSLVEVNVGYSPVVVTGFSLP